MSRAMPLVELLPDVAAVPPQLTINGLVQDSRAIEPGDAFVAIGGFGTHGLHFIEQAHAAGASAILFEPPAPQDLPAPADAIAVPGLRARMGEMADRFHDRPSQAMTTVGVTGTNGKTSTVQLLAQAWHARGLRCGSIGTLGAGLYGEVAPTGFTTPLVLQLHALLADMRDAGAAAVAMEVSLARARAGPRRWRAFRRSRCSPTSPATISTTTATWTATARPRRGCSRGPGCRRP